MKIRIKEELYNSTFFYWVFTNVIKSENTKGNCVHMAITAKGLGEKNIPIPPLSLQDAFAEKMEKIERQKEAVCKAIAETQKLFGYTMDKYFG